MMFQATAFTKPEIVVNAIKALSGDRRDEPSDELLIPTSQEEFERMLDA